MKLLMMMSLLCFGLNARANGVTFLGTTDSGEEMVSTLDVNEYEKHLSQTLSTMDATIEQKMSPAVMEGRGPLRLKMIVLGLGANGEIGIGPFKMGAGIRHRAFFRRSL